MEKKPLDSLARVVNVSESINLSHVKQKEPLPTGPFKTFKPQFKNTRRLACTCCRQQKSKCDAQTRYPLPCTRCAAKDLTCKLNAGFKRTAKRARFALIERDFEQMKNYFNGPLESVDLQRAAPSLGGLAFGSSSSGVAVPFPHAVSAPRILLDFPNSPVLDHIPFNSHYQFQLPYLTNGSDEIARSIPPKIAGPSQFKMPPHANPVPLQHTLNPNPTTALPARNTANTGTLRIQEDSGIFIPEAALVCQEKSLEDVTLSSEMIRTLYLEYVHNYHPILPIVDVTRGPERIYRVCPALFWVIINVTFRRYNEDKSLLLKLSPLVKNILAEITISPIARYNPTEEDEPIMNICSVHSVQAFVLYSLWPPLTSSLSADSSWSTIGLALFQAIRIGLHTSGHFLEQYKNQPEQRQQFQMAQEQMKTWILCNTVSQNIASAFGYPAFVQFDVLSAQHCDFSVSALHIMEIAQFEDQVYKTLNLESSSGISHINERLALLKVLANKLDDLELKVTSESSHENPHLKFQFTLARMHLLSFYFLDAENISSFELSKGLVKLYNTSASLIEHVQMCQARNKRFIEYFPAVAVLNIWQASFFIAKLANSPMKAIIDSYAARKTYTVSVELVAKASILKHDIAYRASGIMRSMWQFFRGLDEKNQLSLHISIKSRAAASVFFDCLSLLRDKVGLTKLNIKTDVRGNTESKDFSMGSPMSGDENGAEDAVASDNEGDAQSDKTGASLRTTPRSLGSSGRMCKKRLISESEDTELTARRIIRTIPLDPQPITASKHSSIFKLVNSDQTSPKSSIKSDDAPVPAAARVTTMQTPGREGRFQEQGPFNGPKPSTAQNFAHPSVPPHETLPGAVSRGDTDVLVEDDLIINQHMLWKDVDSLMNDFGFHA